MTIAIVIHVNDGIVLAADSASTFGMGPPKDGVRPIGNIYENASKIFNLRRGFPLGAVTWGAGSIGDSSIATLAKDFRAHLEELDDKNELEDRISLKRLATRFRDFMFRRYDKGYAEWAEKDKPDLGFVIAGYSPEASHPESWKLFIKGTARSGPTRATQIGALFCGGQAEPIVRMCRGFDNGLEEILRQHGIEKSKVDRVIAECEQRLGIPLVAPAMPIQDTIDLAIFLAETAKRYSKFKMGAPTVGGPIEVAAITKHEGFKWIQRNHYYSADLNPLF